ncbi:uncharacterized protein LOC142335511 isoform X2 [Convolutriloba macropyga]
MSSAKEHELDNKLQLMTPNISKLLGVTLQHKPNRFQGGFKIGYSSDDDSSDEDYPDDDDAFALDEQDYDEIDEHQTVQTTTFFCVNKPRVRFDHESETTEDAF